MLLTVIVPVYNQDDLIIRALGSIPVRPDIEIIVIDDGSTDTTLEKVLEYRAEHPERFITVISLAENKGLGYAKNVGYTNASGMYINQLDSDDYLYTDKYEMVMNELDGTDIVYMDLKINNDTVWSVNKNTQDLFCGGTLRFIRKEFLGDSRCPEIRAGEDWFLNDELQKKEHTDKFTGICAYHYNFPRAGSLCDQRNRGLL